MDDLIVLAVALLAMGAALIGGIVIYLAIWKPRRRRRIERDHARSKVGGRST